MRIKQRSLILIVCGAAASGLLTLAGCLSWRSPPFYELTQSPPLPAPILTQAQYDSVHAFFPRPYVLRCDSGAAQLLVYGASHTRDRNDPQIADLRRQFVEFHPTVVLVEGRPGGPLAGLRDPVAQFGEMGEAVRLARRARCRIWTWEPSKEAEIAAQLTRFPPAHVAMFYVLRPYFGQVRFGKPADPAGFVEPFRKKRTRWKGLEGQLPSIAVIDSIWRQDLAGLPDWRETSDEYGWPGVLSDIAARSNAMRDEHLTQLLLELTGRGERVFAVAGSSHAVKIEPPLTAACGRPLR